ncbi:TonB-dependent receptor [Gallaecimonas mangrovi]|uniref:TonB-dependent receptor n=1 Tax=Gallaecimonas mangrovi TaxID=2291597 RepID=UPI000E1FBD94|nr:TonB-dependent receptor [Gallaecimonas mangrovi]
MHHKKNFPLSCVCLALLSASTTFSAFAANSDSQNTNATQKQSHLKKKRDDVEKIVVTATKRKEDRGDIAGTVDAISQDKLESMAAQSLSDYITQVPGVAFNNLIPGVSEVVLRGMATTTYHEQNQTTTGYYLNQIPLSEPGWPIVIPDIDTFDLQRVEVLRGPQGTLFGSSSLGGLINYVANEASTDGFDAAIEAGMTNVAHSSDTGYSVKGMFNIPITDTFAARLVAVHHKRAGYLDNIGTGKDDANKSYTDGGRLSLVWDPTDSTHISWLSMSQEIDTKDQSYISTGYQRDSLIPEETKPKITLHSLHVDQDLGFATLTVQGSYAHKVADNTLDYTGAYGQGFLGTDDIPTTGHYTTDSYNGEVRLTSPDAQSLRWIVGTMYSHNDEHMVDRDHAKGAVDYINDHPDDYGDDMGETLAGGDLLYDYHVHQKFTEKALFGELNYDFDPQWTLTLGGRYFHTTNNSELHNYYKIGYPLAFDYDEGASDTGFTPKVSLRYKLNDNLMTYALYSEGYRVGGANAMPPSTEYNSPLTYGSDSDKNYELGLRSDWLSHLLSLDFTVYRVDWDNIQVQMSRGDGFSYTTNAGGARNQGAELSFTLRPTDELSWQSNVTYLDSKLTSDLPSYSSTVPSGSRLPGASKWTINNIITWDLDLPYSPRLMLTQHYVSKAPVAFNAEMQRGGYTTYDLKTSVVKGNYQLNFYVNNLFDKYGIVDSPYVGTNGYRSTTILQPRTIGLTLSWKY